MQTLSDTESRLAALKARLKEEGTPEGNMRLWLHLVIATPQTHYPNMVPALAIAPAIIARLQARPQAEHLVSCPCCGKPVGINTVTPILVACCYPRKMLLDPYLLTRVAVHFNYTANQTQTMLDIYTRVLGEYYAITSNNTEGADIPATNVRHQCS